mmetsp:Transcript_11357/g.43883  ORF Transcript_11357/g.43883 Transcript_11357/m.43883 type:complete len:370 (+) Transcript_11357:374-1483(+)
MRATLRLAPSGRCHGSLRCGWLGGAACALPEHQSEAGHDDDARPQGGGRRPPLRVGHLRPQLAQLGEQRGLVTSRFTRVRGGCSAGARLLASMGPGQRCCPRCPPLAIDRIDLRLSRHRGCCGGTGLCGARPASAGVLPAWASVGFAPLACLGRSLSCDGTAAPGLGPGGRGRGCPPAGPGPSSRSWHRRGRCCHRNACPVIRPQAPGCKNAWLVSNCLRERNAERHLPRPEAQRGHRHLLHAVELRRRALTGHAHRNHHPHTHRRCERRGRLGKVGQRSVPWPVLSAGRHGGVVTALHVLKSPLQLEPRDFRLGAEQSSEEPVSSHGAGGGDQRAPARHSRLVGEPVKPDAHSRRIHARRHGQRLAVE